VSWTTSHQNIEAQSQRNSTCNPSSLRTTNTASSDKPPNTFKKLINSLCNTNKAQVVDGNGFLTYVDPYHGIVMQYPSNWDCKEPQAFPVCLLPLKSEGNDTKTIPKSLRQSCGVE
jgi:hypothetical protein